MHGNVATVILYRSFDPAMSCSIADCLKANCTLAKDSRKGRYWEFELDGYAMSLLVEPTAKLPFDYEDDLLENGLDFESAPEAVVITAPVGGPEMRGRLIDLASIVADGLGGLSLGTVD